MSVSIFGIRHHGPGCARCVQQALGELEPDIVLVEGPPDAQEVLPLLASPDMKPPVALLIYVPENPAQAVYYPFATFSPEWQALSYALGRSIPARFFDLPQAYQLGQLADEATIAPVEPLVATPEAQAAQAGTLPVVSDDTDKVSVLSDDTDTALEQEEEPLDMLARAAGYSDYERWWEVQIEQRRDLSQLFDGILEAMTELRRDRPVKDEREARREAHMRQSIRAAQREGFQRIAVICGAWHAPVLTEEALAEHKGDAALLSKLKKVKVDATWIPWTSSRLAYRSGYGAGVTSPGWYEHLWTAPEQAMVRWISLAARLMRAEGLDASSASVIETVRLAETLAAMRGLPTPGLLELREAIQTVLCHGNAEPLALIRQRLEIGEQLGEVPTDAPVVPLVRDLENRQRALKLKQSTLIEKQDLDLRKELDRARSKLFHQLRLLNIEWAKTQRGSSRQMGTFHELWQTQWQVEFSVKLIEANVWGSTVERAATGLARHLAGQAENLPQLTGLLNKVVLAELPEALEDLITVLQSQAAVASDVRQMMDALPPLAQVAREGDVRETRSEHLLPVIDGLCERVIIGLPGACSSLDDDAARAMVTSLDHADFSLEKLDRKVQYAEWQGVLRRLSENEAVHGLVRGRSSRLLFDKYAIDGDELQRLASLALSSAVPAGEAAAWIEGVLLGSGQLMLAQDGLWQVLDAWLCEQVPDTFVELLPLLRRAFSGFTAPERRMMGDKARDLRKPRGANGSVIDSVELDHERAGLVLPVLSQILQVQYVDQKGKGE